jgi:hypothetical protein
MVTKVGRRGNLLICSDCGVPVENIQGQRQHRQRLYASLGLIGLTLLGGMIFVLASMEERLAPRAAQTGQRQGGAAKAEQSQRLPGPALLAPDPKPATSISRPAVPSKSASAVNAEDHGDSKPNHSTLPLPLPLRNKPGDHRPQP